MAIQINNTVSYVKVSDQNLSMFVTKSVLLVLSLVYELMETILMCRMRSKKNLKENFFSEQEARIQHDKSNRTEISKNLQNKLCTDLALKFP